VTAKEGDVVAFFRIRNELLHVLFCVFIPLAFIIVHVDSIAMAISEPTLIFRAEWIWVDIHGVDTSNHIARMDLINQLVIANTIIYFVLVITAYILLLLLDKIIGFCRYRDQTEQSRPEDFYVVKNRMLNNKQINIIYLMLFVAGYIFTYVVGSSLSRAESVLFFNAEWFWGDTSNLRITHGNWRFMSGPLMRGTQTIYVLFSITLYFLVLAVDKILPNKAKN